MELWSLFTGIYVTRFAGKGFTEKTFMENDPIQLSLTWAILIQLAPDSLYYSQTLFPDLAIFLIDNLFVKQFSEGLHCVDLF
jgi:hypothetical protein